MKFATKPAILSIAAGVVLLAGLASAIGAAAYARREKAEIGGKTKALRELRKLESNFRPVSAARDRFELTSSTDQQDLPDLIAQHFPSGVSYEIKPGLRELIDGWRMETREVSFGEADVALLIGLVRSLESQRPPWRLVRCDLAGTHRGPDRVKAVLQLESIRRP